MQANFLGRLGGDAVLKNVNNTAVLEFNVADEVGYGQNKVTQWVRCSIWGGRAESLKPYLTKGKQVFVTGEVKLRTYEGRDGQKAELVCKVADIKFASGSEKGGGQQQQQRRQPQAPSRPQPRNNGRVQPVPQVPDEDIPDYVPQDDGDIPF